MGALSNLGGDGSAQSAASSSLQLGTDALFANVGASIAGAVGNYQQAGYASQIARLNSTNALLAGQSEESASKMKFGALESQAVASAAARGVGVGGESVRATTNTIQSLGDMDAAIIHYNAARQAFGYKSEENIAKSEQTSAIYKGAIDASANFISGASSLSSKALAYKLSGARLMADAGAKAQGPAGYTPMGPEDFFGGGQP